MPGRSRPFAALQRYVPRQPQVAAAGQATPCDLCSELIAFEHRHLLEIATRQVQCVCRARAILFATEAASQGHYRLIPERCLYLEDFRLDAAQWDGLQVPVGLAFFFYSTSAQRVMAFYPGPMGATESRLELRTWAALKAHNAILSTMQPDVETLLVNRARGAQQVFLVPIDVCYRLVGLIRLHWRGLSGGQEVWTEIGRFFETLQKRSQGVKGDERWRSSTT